MSLTNILECSVALYALCTIIALVVSVLNVPQGDWKSAPITTTAIVTVLTLLGPVTVGVCLERFIRE